MSSRNILNLVLLSIVLSLIAIVIFEPGQTPKATNPTLTSLKPDEINHIMIQRDTGRDVELEKIKGVWQMLKPYPLLANDFRVQSLLRLAETNSYSQHDLTTLDIKKFGLDKSHAKITFNKQQTIIFGGNDALQQQRYIQINNVLHLIDDTYYFQMGARATTFSDHSLLAGKKNIVKLDLPKLIIELKEGKWQSMPQNENISADAITDLINHWRNTQAIEMQAVSKINSKITAKIYFKDEKDPLLFYIQNIKGKTALIRKDLNLSYKLSADQIEKLLNLSTEDKNATTEESSATEDRKTP